MCDGQLDNNILLLLLENFLREDLVQYDKKQECPDNDQGIPGNLCPLLSKALVKDRNMDLNFQDK